MTRHPDWQKRLIAYLSQVRARPFKTGRHDCTLFSAGCVEAMTGVDLARGFRGYRTPREGQRMLERKGFTDHVDLIASQLEECRPLMARPGDVAIIEPASGLSVGIVQGQYIYVLSPAGVGLVNLTDAIRAFRV